MTSDYVLAQFDNFKMVFAGNSGELSFVMMVLAMNNQLNEGVNVLSELGGYTISKLGA